jgi:hypothetical protein
MSLSTRLRPSLGKLTLFLFLLTILQLLSSGYASGQPTVQPEAGSPSLANPCAVIGFQLINPDVPAGANLQKIEYYGNGVYVGTTLNVTDVQKVTVNANDGNGGTYNVYAVVY